MADIAKKQQLSKAQILLPSSLTVEIRTGQNKSIDELIEVVKEVAGAIDCPLVVEGRKT